MANLMDVPAGARWLGLAGVIPFIGLAALSWLAQAPQPNGLEWAAPLLTGYGVVILSFMGGCRWGLAAAGMGEGASTTMLAISVIPALYAWIVALLPNVYAQPLLALGLLALLAADLSLAKSGGAPAWWPSLRWPLSVGASASLFAGAAALA
ncbi:MAG: DUF3429 domain-containing protein [Pseudomonadota bacterium]